MAAGKFPLDRFDAVPRGGKAGTRTGAHRVHPKPRFWVRWVLAVLLCTLLFSLLGILWLMRVGAESTVFTSAKEAAERALIRGESQNQQGDVADAQPGAVSKPDSGAPEPAPTPASQPAPEPQINPNASVVVLNGTGRTGLAAQFGRKLTSNNWGVLDSVADADRADYAKTTVFYADPAFADAAAALARHMGDGTTAKHDTAYAARGSNLVVVLGADWLNQ